jgi:hypothetical protein
MRKERNMVLATLSTIMADNIKENGLMENSMDPVSYSKTVRWFLKDSFQLAIL